jgi:hypothetical protein
MAMGGWAGYNCGHNSVRRFTGGRTGRFALGLSPEHCFGKAKPAQGVLRRRHRRTVAGTQKAPWQAGISCCMAAWAVVKYASAQVTRDTVGGCGWLTSMSTAEGSPRWHRVPPVVQMMAQFCQRLLSFASASSLPVYVTGLAQHSAAPVFEAPKQGRCNLHT